MSFQEVLAQCPNAKLYAVYQPRELQGLWCATWGDLLNVGGVALRGKKFEGEQPAREWLSTHRHEAAANAPLRHF